MSYHYPFPIDAMMKQAWHQTKGFKGVFLGTLLFYVLLQLVIAAIFTLVMFLIAEPVALQHTNGARQLPASVYWLEFAEVLISAYIDVFCMATLMVLGIKRARGIEVKFSSMFKGFSKSPKLFLAYILLVILVFVGFLILILPGIYFTIATYFILPLILDKHCSIGEAFKLSISRITSRWFGMLGLTFLISLIVMISILPLGIGLIWSLPWASITLGQAYVRMFDREDEVSEPSLLLREGAAEGEN